MFTIFQILPKFTITTALTHLPRNPYLYMPHSQLLQQIHKQLHLPTTSIHQANTLIKLGLALQQQSFQLHLKHSNQLMGRCMEILMSIHQNDNYGMKEAQLRVLELGMLVQLLGFNCDELGNSWVTDVLQLYENCYKQIVPIQTHLQIYKNSTRSLQQPPNPRTPTLQYLQTLSHKAITHQIQHSQPDIRTYLQYCRLFQSELSKDDFKQRITKYILKDQSIELEEIEKGALCFIGSQLMGYGEYTEAMMDLVEPGLEIGNVGIMEQKLVCFVLELRQYKGMGNKGVSSEFLGLGRIQWDYDHLVWVSEFISNKNCPDYVNICKQLHTLLLSSTIPPQTSLSSIHPYLLNLSDTITPQTHQQISTWLSTHKLSAQDPHSLCQLLKLIDDNRWSAYYTGFYGGVLEYSLGNLEWQFQNQIYYYGIVWGIQDERMEYLRRYILNGYASMGVNRREIPTSSYFYRILGVTDSNTFYKNL